MIGERSLWPAERTTKLLLIVSFRRLSAHKLDRRLVRKRQSSKQVHFGNESYFGFKERGWDLAVILQHFSAQELYLTRKREIENLPSF